MTLNHKNDQMNFEDRLFQLVQDGYVDRETIELFVFDWNEAETAAERLYRLGGLCRIIESHPRMFPAMTAETILFLGQQSLSRFLDNRRVDNALEDKELDVVATELKKSRHPAA